MIVYTKNKKEAQAVKEFLADLKAVYDKHIELEVSENSLRQVVLPFACKTNGYTINFTPINPTPMGVSAVLDSLRIVTRRTKDD